MARKVEEAPAEEGSQPRQSVNLFGHDGALATLRSAISHGRMHHAWILAGPRGIGKATLAYRVARYLLKYGSTTRGPEDFAVDASDPIFKMTAARAHPDLMVLARPWDHEKKRFKTELPVDEVRRLQHFFSQHASAGGARVAIIDTADEMNRNAANALLKALEEPPQNAFLFLISNAPGSLIPTIRSRCRVLTMQPLDSATLARALAQSVPDAKPAMREKAALLSGGSLGQSIELLEDGGLALYDSLIAVLSQWPRIDMRRVHALSNEVGGRGQESTFGLMRDLLLSILSRAIRAAAEQVEPALPEERKLAQQLAAGASVDRWLALWDNVAALLAATEDANLDKRQAVVSAFATIGEVGASSRRAAS